MYSVQRDVGLTVTVLIICDLIVIVQEISLSRVMLNLNDTEVPNNLLSSHFKGVENFHTCFRLGRPNSTDLILQTGEYYS